MTPLATRSTFTQVFIAPASEFRSNPAIPREGDPLMNTAITQPYRCLRVTPIEFFSTPDGDIVKVEVVYIPVTPLAAPVIVDDKPTVEKVEPMP